MIKKTFPCMSKHPSHETISPYDCLPASRESFMAAHSA